MKREEKKKNILGGKEEQASDSYRHAVVERPSQASTTEDPF